ncbi:2-nitropropane dioxygenase [Mycobacterium tuberculosis]|nr:2-nitropropane dioxygenase [Mycobacterium tuberculosis]
MVLSTAFSQMFGIDYPIVSAPMDLIAGGELAAAVSGAGGLGLIGAAMGTGIGWPGSSISPLERRWAAGSSPGLWPANRSCSTSRCSMSRWR